MSDRNLGQTSKSNWEAIAADIVLPGMWRTFVAAQASTGSSERSGGESWLTKASTEAARTL